MSITATPPRERGIWLTGWLIYMLLANLWVAFRSIEVYANWESRGIEYFTGYGTVTLLVMALCGEISALLVWLRKRAGLVIYSIYITAAAITLVINLFVFRMSGVVFTVVIGPLVLVALFNPKWHRFMLK